MTLTWDPDNNNGMILSNGNLTASSPDNGTDSYVWDYATQPITAGEKVFFQIDVSGGNGRDLGMAGGPGTGFDAGFAAHGFSPTLIDDSGDPNNGAPFGNTIVSSTYPSTADGFTSGYDGGLNLGGYLVAEVHRGVSEWGDPSYVDYALDRTTDKFWVYSSSTGEWNDDPDANPATGTGGYDISPVGNQTLYAIVGTLQVGNSSATLVNQDSDIQGSVPAGFTTLQDLGSGSSSSSSTPASSNSSSSNPSSSGSSSSNPPSSGSSSSTPTAPTASGGDTVTVDEPSPLTVGQVTITGHESDSSQPVYLAGHTFGTPDSISEHDVVQATVDSDTGDFHAPVTIDTPGVQSTMFYSTGGPFSAVFSGTPSDGSSTSAASGNSGSDAASGSAGSSGSPAGGTSTTASSSGSGSSGSGSSGSNSSGSNSSGNASSGTSSTATADGVTVNVPTPFVTGDITFTGVDHNADKTLHLDWHTYGTPSLGDHDDVPVAVNSDGTLDRHTGGAVHALRQHGRFVRAAIHRNAGQSCFRLRCIDRDDCEGGDAPRRDHAVQVRRARVAAGSSIIWIPATRWQQSRCWG